MNFREYVKSKRSNPIMFVGSGITRRYCNYPDWNEFINILGTICLENDNKLFIKKQNLKREFQDKGKIISDFELNVMLASYLEEEYLQKDMYTEYDNEIINVTKEKNYESMFKVLVANQIEMRPLLENDIYKAELQSLKSIDSKVLSFITTNYDEFLEKTFSNREKIISNDIIGSNPYNAIYKIHGCMKHPNSIIFTEADYKMYEENSKLINAQLISLFIHNPVIFLGYSVTDENVKAIISTIFKFTDPNSEKYKNLSSNFIIISYKDTMETVVSDYNIDLGIKHVSIKLVETNNFKEIFDSIANIQVDYSVKDLRVMKDAFKKIEFAKHGSDAPKLKILLDDSADDSEKVLYFTTNDNIIEKNISPSTFSSSYFEHEEMHLENEDSLDTIKSITFPSIQFIGNAYYPFSLYTDVEELVDSQKQKLSGYYSIIPSRLHLKHKSISEIRDNKNIAQSNIDMVIFYNVVNKNIELSDLRGYLKRNWNNPNILQRGYRNKLTTLYDYMTYGGGEIDFFDNK